MQDNIFTVKDLSFAYGKQKVLDDLALTLHEGTITTLIGANGCGKSTLLKLIQQEPLDYTGTQQIPAGLILSTVPQDPSFLQGDLREFVRREGLDESLFKAVLRKLEFSRAQFDKAMQHFSAGQKKKVLLAKSLCQSAHLYLWDEPLNYIDLFSRMQIEQLILDYEPTLLFVEHDEAFTQKIATRIVELG